MQEAGRGGSSNRRGRPSPAPTVDPQRLRGRMQQGGRGGGGTQQTNPMTMGMNRMGGGMMGGGMMGGGMGMNPMMMIMMQQAQQQAMMQQMMQMQMMQMMMSGGMMGGVMMGGGMMGGGMMGGGMMGGPQTSARQQFNQGQQSSGVMSRGMALGQDRNMGGAYQGGFETMRLGHMRNRNASEGFIPNFSAVKEAVGRETQGLMKRGLSKSQAKSSIYVAKHSSITANSGGLGVFNKIDEPKGASQGINRAVKEGSNINTYGKATGFVPNLQAPSNLQLPALSVLNDTLVTLSSLVQEQTSAISEQGPDATGTVNLDNSDVVAALGVLQEGLGNLQGTMADGFGAMQENISKDTLEFKTLPVKVDVAGSVANASDAIVKQLESKVGALLGKTLDPGQAAQVNSATGLG